MCQMISLLGCLLLLTISLGVPSALAINKVLSLDGDRDYVMLSVPKGSELDITNKITLEVWVNPSGDSWGGIIAHGNDELGSYELWYHPDMFDNWTEIRFSINWNSNWQHCYRSNVFLNKWSHVAATYDSSTGIVKLYVNGEYSGSNQRSS